MWELYAFWTLTPLLIGRELERLGEGDGLIPWLAFAVIGIGGLGCVGGGRLSHSKGSEWVARRALTMSGPVLGLWSLARGAHPAFPMNT